MAFHPFEVSTPHVIYALLGGFIVLFGMFSLLLREKLYIGEACWAFIFGIAMGPYGANIFNPRGWGNDAVANTITLELTRVVLAIGVFAIGVELPKQYMKKHWKSLFFLLLPVMTWGWFVSAGLIYALIPALNFRSSLAIAACLTPTDPILAAAVVGGKYADKHVPAHIRHLLAAESGCNDGAAFPFLFIALYLIIDTPNTGNAIKDWFLLLWLYQIVMGTVIGALVGFLFRHLMKFCEQRNLIDRHSYVAQYVSLSIFTIGVTVMLGSDDLLATFACGTAFAWDGFFNRQTEESNFSSVIDLLFNIGAFIYVGAWMPFKDFDDVELSLSAWRLVVIAILVMLLRRLPIMVALYRWIPDIKTLREAIFCGHFGPIGIGAVFISTLATETLEQASSSSSSSPSHQTEILTKSLQPIVAFMVLCSVTVHGLSIPSFSLGRRVHSVSRTWSRHASLGGGNLPDWTNQARLVKRGEDVVINRDDEGSVEGEKVEVGDLDLEKGVLNEDGNAEASGSGSGSGSGASSTRIMEDSTTLENSRVVEDRPTPGAHHEHAKDDEEGYKEETPPDGLEVLAEWQEGPHTVIERRAGPGEEVEVEVIRNTHPHQHQHHGGHPYLPHPHYPHYHHHQRHGSDSSSGEHPKERKIFRGEREYVHGALSAYLARWKHGAEEAVEDVKEGVREGVREVERVVSPEGSLGSPGSEKERGGVAVASAGGESAIVDDDDEEEGWASEQDDTLPHPQTTTKKASALASARKKSKSPKSRSESFGSGSGSSSVPSFSAGSGGGGGGGGGNSGAPGGSGSSTGVRKPVGLFQTKRRNSIRRGLAGFTLHGHGYHGGHGMHGGGSGSVSGGGGASGGGGGGGSTPHITILTPPIPGASDEGGDRDSDGGEARRGRRGFGRAIPRPGSSGSLRLPLPLPQPSSSSPGPSSPGPSSPGSPNSPGSPGSIQSPRVQHLRTHMRRRDSSPARSIRFADEFNVGGAGAGDDEAGVGRRSSTPSGSGYVTPRSGSGAATPRSGGGAAGGGGGAAGAGSGSGWQLEREGGGVVRVGGGGGPGTAGEGEKGGTPEREE